MSGWWFAAGCVGLFLTLWAFASRRWKRQALILKARRPNPTHEQFIALLVFSLLWFGTLQILWFAHHLRTGYWRAAGHASRAMVEALVLFTVVSQIFR